MMKVKELKVATFVTRLNIYGFKQTKQGRRTEVADLVISGGGHPKWVNGQRYRFYHEDFHSKGNLTSLLRIKQNQDTTGVTNEEIPQEHASEDIS